MKRPSPAELHTFDDLPAAALVRLPFVAALLSVSGSTVWRWCRAGKFPQPAYLGGVALWNVGELRKALRFRNEADGETQPEDPRVSTGHTDSSS